jgi:predicted DNA-binding mobile mystery protein A
MQSDKTIRRQRLDNRLGGLGFTIGARPLSGWVREIRVALSMTTTELAKRMGISQSRASRLERAEVDETIRVATLRRAAQALNCTLHYVLVPNEPLADMVLRQAHLRATQELASSDSDIWVDAPIDTPLKDEWLEAHILDLVDRRGLWR